MTEDPREQAATARAEVEALGERHEEAGVRQLEDFARSDRVELALEALEAQLGPTQDERSYTRVEAALVPLVGPQAFITLSSVASFRGTELTEILDDIGLTAEARGVVTRMMVLHGSRFAEALARSPRAPLGWEDWRTVHRDITLDVETGLYRVILGIERRDGQILRLEGTPSSMLRLTRSLLRIIRRVDDRAAFDDDDVEAFSETVDELKGFLAETPSDTSQESNE